MRRISPFDKLSARLGLEDAHNELRWIKQSSSNPREVDRMIEERVKGKPLQYILGDQPFLDTTIKVKPPVLIPRPETEYWTNELIRRHKDKTNLRIIDLCTGSGCIAINLAKELRNSTVRAYDKSDDACELTKENAKLNLTVDQLSRFEVIKRDIMTHQFHDKFDILTMNPPYITKTDYQAVDKSVREWEDVDALLAKSNDAGIEFYMRVIEQLLRSNLKGEIWFEVGYNQADLVSKLVDNCSIERIKDPFGDFDRAIILYL
ncbi:S-adenosyl-L-methionine-dependent methyltransferase [Wallemia mellicola]|nr:S-adenosyl-L-methionine-dependent methyltransferase [Wallemia mellicola]